jgi:mono/diheme cytochrome c family protein
MTYKVATAALFLLLVLSTTGRAQEDGAALYQKKCSTCHGASGEGKGKTPALKGTSKSANQILQHITQGDPGSKGPHKKAVSGISEDQAKAIAEFVKGLK